MIRIPAVLAAVTAVLALLTAPAAAAPNLPSDPAARGTVGLCDRSGKPVTSGGIDDKPFVWRAVGSNPAPAPFDRAGAFATLYAFQPRPNVPPDQWSGDTLTAGSVYTNTAHPMAQATQLDFTLTDLLAQFPTKLDGLLQLRLYYSAPEVGPNTSEYAATYIQVTGTRWTVAQSTTSFSCTDGSATSSEVGAGIVDKDGNAVGTAAASLSASASAAAATSASGSPTSGVTGAGPVASPTPSGTGAVGQQNATADRSGGGSNPAPWIVLAAVVVLAGIGGAWWWRRRRVVPTPEE